jgi:hypothetical protein
MDLMMRKNKQLTTESGAHQQKKKRRRAQERDPPGRIAVPQQKHLLAAMTSTWLSNRKNNAPTPNPVEMSESYTQ